MTVSLPTFPSFDVHADDNASPENVVIAVDMLLTGIHVQPEENVVTPAGKLDILLMFAEQTLLRKMEKWLL